MNRRKFMFTAVSLAMFSGCTTSEDSPDSEDTTDQSPNQSSNPETTQDPTPDQSNTGYSTSRVKSEAEDIPYDDLLRNIERYEGEEIHSLGEISQSFEEGDRFAFNIAMERSSGFWDGTKNAFVVWDGDRYIEDDVVEFWGVVEGTYDYETVLGSRRTVPLITAVDMQLIDETTTDPEATIRITEVDTSWTEYDSEFIDDSGRISSVSAVMENTGKIEFEPTVDVAIMYNGNQIYSEQNAQGYSLETAPGQTQEFSIIPFQEVTSPGQYTVEVTLRKSGSQNELDSVTYTVDIG